jgi:hypothetical protein
MYVNACASKGIATTSAAHCRPVIIPAPLMSATAADGANHMHGSVPTDAYDRQSRLPAVPPDSVEVPMPLRIVLSRMIAVPN